LVELRVPRLPLAVVVSVAFAARCALAADAFPPDALFLPPDLYRPAAASAPPDAEGAAQWLAQAEQALAQGSVAETLRCAAAALACDPDQPQARRLLGQQRVGDHWAGGYAARLLAAGRQWHPQWGWIQPEHLPQFEAGLRPLGRRWISAEEDAARHAKIADGWTIRTDNFQVTTNESPAAAVELASRLEGIYLLWLQRFGDYALTPEQLRKRWDGDQASGYRRQPFRVVYHRSRAEYNEALRVHQPQIDITLGIYFDHLRQCHFFAGDDQDPGTVRHEATHQFFQESGRSARRAAAVANAWALEGVACYFESLAPLAVPGDLRGSTAWRLGGAEAGRLPAARQRRLRDGYYVALAELAELGMTELQTRPDLPPLYSQAAGLATFFVEGQGGRYREAFVELLRQIYAGRDEPGTLERLSGESYRELDRQYEQYLREAVPSVRAERLPGGSAAGGSSREPARPIANGRGFEGEEGAA
jgi:hypothetical protein